MVAVNEANTNALEAGRPSDMTPINCMTQIVKIKIGKNNPSVAEFEIHWNILRRSLVSFAAGTLK